MRAEKQDRQKDRWFDKENIMPVFNGIVPIEDDDVDRPAYNLYKPVSFYLAHFLDIPKFL